MFGWCEARRLAAVGRMNEAAARAVALAGKRFKCGPWAWTIPSLRPGGITWLVSEQDEVLGPPVTS